MAFRYVDRILEIEPGKRIVGLKNVTRTEPYLFHFEDGSSALSPFIVSEAAAQLGGWLLMHASDFDQRAVLLADEDTRYPELARPGDQIRLEVEIVSQDDEVIVSRGRGYVGDRVVIDGQCCRGYLLPTVEFSDPEMERLRFERLFRPDLAAQASVQGFLPNRLLPDSPRMPSMLHLDGVIDVTAQGVRAYKNVSMQEAFFEAHFPRRAVVPGVIQLEMCGQASQLLVPSGSGLRLIPRATRGVRLRKFVEPGDRVDIDVHLLDGDARKAGSTVRVGATLSVDGKRSFQVHEMEFTVHAMRQSVSASVTRSRLAEIDA